MCKITLFKYLRDVSSCSNLSPDSKLISPWWTHYRWPGKSMAEKARPAGRRLSAETTLDKYMLEYRVSEEWMYIHALYLSTLTVSFLSHVRPLLSPTEGILVVVYTKVFDIPTKWNSVPATPWFTSITTFLPHALFGRMSPSVDGSAPCRGCSFWGCLPLLSMCYYTALAADKFLLGVLHPPGSAKTACPAQPACALSPLRVYDAPQSQSGIHQAWFAQFIFSVTWTCRSTVMERQTH